MSEQDPIHVMEKMMKQMHDSAGHYSRPVLRRYPLLFGFLLVFSFAAILHGFQLTAQRIEFVNEHPWVLIVLGSVVLFFTGRLYKALKK